MAQNVKVLDVQPCKKIQLQKVVSKDAHARTHMQMHAHVRAHTYTQKEGEGETGRHSDRV